MKSIFFITVSVLSIAPLWADKDQDKKSAIDTAFKNFDSDCLDAISWFENQMNIVTQPGAHKKISPDVSKKQLDQQKEFFINEIVTSLALLFDDTEGIGQGATQWRGMSKSAVLKKISLNENTIPIRIRNLSKKIKLSFLGILASATQSPPPDIPSNSDALKNILLIMLEKLTVDQLESLLPRIDKFKDEILSTYTVLHAKLLDELELISSFKSALEAGKNQMTIYRDLVHDKSVEVAINGRFEDFQSKKTPKSFKDSFATISTKLLGKHSPFQQEHQEKMLDEAKKQLLNNWKTQVESFRCWECFEPYEISKGIEEVERARKNLNEFMRSHCKDLINKFIENLEYSQTIQDLEAYFE